MKKRSVLLLTKDSEWGQLAYEILQKYECEIECHKGRHGEKMPQIAQETYDLILSFSSPWIVPKNLLEKVGKAAINFHPGPPNYPGIGCTNFALYNEEIEFGATCHHMASRVDSGDIIAVARFPAYKTDTVLRITGRTYAHMFKLYENVLSEFFTKGMIAKSDEKWTRDAYTRKELNNLCIVKADMSAEEILKRIRATKFPGKPGAYIELAGKKFICRDY